MRKAMVEKDYPQLSVRRQCQLLDVNRNRLDPREPKTWEPSEEHLEMMELMKLAHRKDPTMGARQLQRILARQGYEVTRWIAVQMMKHLGLQAIYCRPRTTVSAEDHPKYPYLLRDQPPSQVDEVWATDITYIPWGRGWVYLCAMIDWKTRAVLAWRLSNTMEVDFCLSMLCEAVSVSGTVPKILNTDQGSQFTSVDWLSAVESLGVQASMDGKGSWRDNILIERLWRSVKHEWVLLHDYETLPELESLLSEWMDRYNRWRPHTANEGQTPWQAYRGEPPILERDGLEMRRASEESRALNPPFILPTSKRKVA
ncbi:MAG: IS3 family transposase [Verrucomicrobiota bacterium]